MCDFVFPLGRCINIFRVGLWLFPPSSLPCLLAVLSCLRSGKRTGRIAAGCPSASLLASIHVSLHPSSLPLLPLPCVFACWFPADPRIGEKKSRGDLKNSRENSVVAIFKDKWIESTWTKAESTCGLVKESNVNV